MDKCKMVMGICAVCEEEFIGDGRKIVCDNEECVKVSWRVICMLYLYYSEKNGVNNGKESI